MQRHLVQSGTSVACTVVAIAGASLWEERVAGIAVAGADTVSD